MAEILIKKGKKYNIFDKINNVWNQLSIWTHSDDVEFDDGKTASTKVGAINGISSSSTATDENIAASIGYVNQELTELNTNLTELYNGKSLLKIIIQSYGDRSSYTGYINSKSNDNFYSYEVVYRNTSNHVHYSDMGSARLTMPESDSGGSLVITDSGNHTITVLKNTCNAIIPKSFTNSATINGWNSDGVVIVQID